MAYSVRHASSNLSEMVPEIHTTETYYYPKHITFLKQFNSLFYFNYLGVLIYRIFTIQLVLAGGNLHTVNKVPLQKPFIINIQ